MSNAIKNNHEHFDIKYDMKVDFMFSFVIPNVSYKNKNKGQQLQYSKMTCEKMKNSTKILYLNLLKKTNIHVKLKLI